MTAKLAVPAAVAAAILVWELLEAAYKRTGSYRRSLGNIGNMVQGVPQGLDIANIGSGPGLYAIRYEACKKKGFNFATAPQSYKNGFRLLRRYEECINPGAIIIIIIMCPLSFGNNLDYARRGYSDKFYAVLPPQEIDGYSRLRALMLYHALALRAARLAARAARKALRILKPAKKGAGGRPESADIPIIRVWKKEFALADLKDASQAAAHEEAFAQKVGILKECVAFCRQKSWRPVFVVPPVSPKVRSFISDEFAERFVYANLSKIEGVDVLDYYRDARFSDAAFLENGVFLKEESAGEFSAALFADISQIFGGESI